MDPDLSSHHLTIPLKDELEPGNDIMNIWRFFTKGEGAGCKEQHVLNC